MIWWRRFGRPWSVCARDSSCRAPLAVRPMLGNSVAAEGDLHRGSEIEIVDGDAVGVPSQWPRASGVRFARPSGDAEPPALSPTDRTSRPRLTMARALRAAAA